MGSSEVCPSANAPAPVVVTAEFIGRRASLVANGECGPIRPVEIVDVTEMVRARGGQWVQDGDRVLILYCAEETQDRWYAVLASVNHGDGPFAPLDDLTWSAEVGELIRMVVGLSREELATLIIQAVPSHLPCRGLSKNEVEVLIQNELVRREAVSLVRCLRKTPWLLYVVTTGATGDLGKVLWQPAGASRTILADRFTYAEQETAEFLGFKPEKAVSVDTACYLATAAYFQGRKLAVWRGKLEDDVMGVGMTCAVTTDYDRRGADQVIVAIRTHEGLFTVSAMLHKAGTEDPEAYRVEQGNFADLITLNAILAVAGISQQVTLPATRVVRSDEMDRNDFLTPTRVPFAACENVDRLPYGKVIMPDGTMVDPATFNPSEWILFPGSFNPITYAHDEIARCIQRATGKRVLFQITRRHPNKPVTDRDMAERAEQFRYGWPVILLEGAGLYVEKARLFPGMEMLVGADAVLEMLDPRHYDGRGGLEAALGEMDRLRTGFHVNGRTCPQDGIYREADLLPVQPRFAGMFHPFSLRYDVSSSDRRAAGATV